MEWLPGVIAGVVAGAFGSLVTPWAQMRAATATEVARIRSDHRRWLLSNGRQLFSEALIGSWSDQQVAFDWRYLALRKHLTKGGAAPFAASGDIVQILDVIENLEEEWGLT